VTIAARVQAPDWKQTDNSEKGKTMRPRAQTRSSCPCLFGRKWAFVQPTCNGSTALWLISSWSGYAKPHRLLSLTIVSSLFCVCDDLRLTFFSTRILNIVGAGTYFCLSTCSSRLYTTIMLPLGLNAYTFLGLNAVRVLSIVALILVFVSNILVMVE
jgi:hypothetical protein